METKRYSTFLASHFFRFVLQIREYNAMRVVKLFLTVSSCIYASIERVYNAWRILNRDPKIAGRRMHAKYSVTCISCVFLSFYAEIQRREPPEVQAADSGTRVEIEPAKLDGVHSCEKV